MNIRILYTFFVVFISLSSNIVFCENADVSGYIGQINNKPPIGFVEDKVLEDKFYRGVINCFGIDGVNTSLFLNSENIIYKAVVEFINIENTGAFFKTIKSELGEPDSYGVPPQESGITLSYFYRNGLVYEIKSDEKRIIMTIKAADFPDYEIFGVPNGTLIIRTAYSDVNGNGSNDRVLLLGRKDPKNMTSFIKLYLFAVDGETREILQGKFNYKLDGGLDPQLVLGDVNNDGISDVLLYSRNNAANTLNAHLATFAKGEFHYLVDPMELSKGEKVTVNFSKNFIAAISKGQKVLKKVSIAGLKDELVLLGIYKADGNIKGNIVGGSDNIYKINMIKNVDNTVSLVTEQVIYGIAVPQRIASLLVKYQWNSQTLKFDKTIFFE